MRLTPLGTITNNLGMSVDVAIAAGWPAFAGYRAPCGCETWVPLKDRDGRPKSASTRRAEARGRIERNCRHGR
jgi:hypothetical protein